MRKAGRTTRRTTRARRVGESPGAQAEVRAANARSLAIGGHGAGAFAPTGRMFWGSVLSAETA